MSPEETRIAFARSLSIWIRQDGVGVDFITERLAEYDAEKPCQNVVKSGEGSQYCALAESSVLALKDKVLNLESERENWRMSSVAREAVARADSAEASVAKLRAGITKIAEMPTDQLASDEQCAAVVIAMDLIREVCP